MKLTARDIDDYILGFPEQVQDKLRLIRDTISKAAPDAEECINYGIPTFRFHGYLVHFAAYKTHFGFYPGASGIAEFKKELAKYNTSKGTVKFPLDKDLPLDLISDIVVFRLDENLRKVKSGKTK